MDHQPLCARIMKGPPHPIPHEFGGVPVISETNEICDGSVSREVAYEDGKDRGPFVEYDRFGRVIKEGIRRGDWTLESVSTSYAPDGTVLKRTRYRHGEGRSNMVVPSEEL